MKRKYTLGIVVLIAVVVISLFTLTKLESPTGRAIQDADPNAIVYGISPYQDTMIPVLAKELGWYEEEGLNVRLKVLAWGEVMPALASGSIDVAIQNFNSFQATYENINEQGGDVIFYVPFYVFKGAAIMVNPDELITYEEMKKKYSNEDKALRETAKQLRSKTIFVTRGTEMEEIVLKALEEAGLTPEDANIVHAQPEDSLSAFLRGDGDAFSAGVTQHMTAYKQGAVPLLTAGDLGLVVIDGIVTRESFAEEHPEQLKKLTRLWFKSISTMDKDLNRGASIVIEELNKHGSYTFDVGDYEYTWLYTQYYPTSIEEAQKALLEENSPYYWKRSWDKNNQFLMKEGKISDPVPYSAFLGETTLQIAIEE